MNFLQQNQRGGASKTERELVALAGASRPGQGGRWVGRTAVETGLVDDVGQTGGGLKV